MGHPRINTLVQVFGVALGAAALAFAVLAWDSTNVTLATTFFVLAGLIAAAGVAGLFWHLIEPSVREASPPPDPVAVAASPVGPPIELVVEKSNVQVPAVSLMGSPDFLFANGGGSGLGAMAIWNRSGAPLRVQRVTGTAEFVVFRADGNMNTLGETIVVAEIGLDQLSRMAAGNASAASNARHWDTSRDPWLLDGGEEVIATDGSLELPNLYLVIRDGAQAEQMFLDWKADHGEVEVEITAYTDIGRFTMPPVKWPVTVPAEVLRRWAALPQTDPKPSADAMPAIARPMDTDEAANPFKVTSLHEEGWFGTGTIDPNEGYVRLSIEATRRIERVSVRVVEVYQVMHGALLRLVDAGPVNLIWSSSETQAVEDRQFLNLSPDGVPHIVDVAVCGRAQGSTNIRLIGARDSRPPLPAERYKIVLVVSSDSSDTGHVRLEYGLYRLDRPGIGTTLILRDWEWIGEALLEATRPPAPDTSPPQR